MELRHAMMKDGDWMRTALITEPRLVWAVGPARKQRQFGRLHVRACLPRPCASVRLCVCASLCVCVLSTLSALSALSVHLHVDQRAQCSEPGPQVAKRPLCFRAGVMLYLDLTVPFPTVVGRCSVVVVVVVVVRLPHILPCTALNTLTEATRARIWTSSSRRHPTCPKQHIRKYTPHPSLRCPRSLPRWRCVRACAPAGCSRRACSRGQTRRLTSSMFAVSHTCRTHIDQCSAGTSLQRTISFTQPW